MKHIAELFIKLDYTKTKESKIDLLIRFFNGASEKTILWLLFLISKNHKKRYRSTQELKQLCLEYTGFNEWIFDVSKSTVGDVVETMSLMLPVANNNRELDFGKLAEEIEKDGITNEQILSFWGEMDVNENLIFNKFVTGTLKFSIDLSDLAEAFAISNKQEKYSVLLNLDKDWTPSKIGLNELLRKDNESEITDCMFPEIEYFSEEDIDRLQNQEDIFLFYKSLLVYVHKNKGQVAVVSQNKEPLHTCFSWDYSELSWLKDNNHYLGFLILRDKNRWINIDPEQKELTRFLKRNQKKLCVALFAVVDKSGGLEPAHNAISIDSELNTNVQVLAPIKNAIAALEEMKNGNANGIFTIDKTAHRLLFFLKKYRLKTRVIYAERRGGVVQGNFNLLSVAVDSDGELIKMATVENTLSDAEKAELDIFIKNNTEERFGPVKKIKPDIVLEIEFEEIIISKRHKAGFYLKNVRIIKQLSSSTDISTIDDVQKMLI